MRDETLALHSGFEADPATKAVAVPIYQTAAYQFEGDNEKSDWARWERVPGRIQDGSSIGLAADHYRRYEEDFDLCARLGNNAHRLSLEWARIEPQEGTWDEEEIAHYRAVLEALKRRGMKAMVTIWHFSLPQWFADKGGWEHPAAVILYTRYVRLCAGRVR